MEKIPSWREMLSDESEKESRFLFLIKNFRTFMGYGTIVESHKQRDPNAPREEYVRQLLARTDKKLSVEYFEAFKLYVALALEDKENVTIDQTYAPYTADTPERAWGGIMLNVQPP